MMTDIDLKKSYETGKIWVTNRMQVSGTNKDVLGQIYNHSTFLAGLHRVELLEDELMVRGLI